MSLQIGQQLGSYHITSLIGKGGMGEVYRAKDTKLKRDVAIKILPDEFSRDTDRVSRFQREAESLAALNHQNIAAIYDLQQSDATRFLILEFVEGDTLADILKKRGALPIDEALNIAKQICEALEAAHEKGIIHRDLKPANVKITPDGRVKVLDFGLAKAFEAESSKANLSQSPTLSMAATNAGVILGTAAYMSPEQAKGRPVDRRTDIFAFGCVFYEMLTGRAVFEGEDIPEILSRVLQRDPDWNLLPTDAPQAIKRLLRLCLEKDVKKRRRDAGDVNADLEEALAEPITVIPATTVVRGGRLSLILSAAAVLLAAGLAIPTVRHLREVRSSPPEMRLDINTPVSSRPLMFAISPNGTHLVFVANDNGTQRLWVRPLNGVAALPLPGTDGASYPFWSPDSRSIGFFAGGKLRRIEIDGGPPTILADGPGAFGGTWNDHDVILFNPNLNAPLSRVSATGGTPQVATHLGQGHAYHRLPQFLPDGDHFIFYVQATSDQSGIYFGSLSDNVVKRLIAADAAAAWVPPDWLLYVQQGALRAQALDIEHGTLAGDPVTIADTVGYDALDHYGGFSASASGMVAYRRSAGLSTQLTWFNRKGVIAGTVGAPDVDGLDTRFPELSADGRRVALDRSVQSNTDVWLIDVLTGVATRFTFDAAIDRRPLWSPDGMKIIFESNRKNAFDLYTTASSGVGAEQLLHGSANQKRAYSWSHDGRFVLYGENSPTTGSDLWALTMQEDRKRVGIATTPFDERNGQFSPDDQWVAYQSDESGRLEIYVVSFPAGRSKRQVSTGGGAWPRWRPDGKELFFVALDGRMMGATILASRTGFEMAAPTTLFETHIQTGRANKDPYDVSRDGRFLMDVVTNDPMTSPITLLLNWSPEHEK